MVCKLFYESYYPADCDISKWGEGCEQCINSFTHNPILLTILGIVVFLGALILVIKMFNSTKNEIKEDKK